jgi:sterol desaturase/sphingolipid hydroxylase (fatty acid hydroxylase superfamily)
MHLGRLGYFSDFFVYPALIAGLSAWGLSGATLEAATRWIGLALCSLALWTLLEYLLHRYVLHHFPYVKEMHHAHHVEEKASIGTPTWASLGVFAIVIVLPAWLGLGPFMASAITAGMMAGYLWYISVHHIVHHWHPGHSSYVYGLKRRHALHHHFDETANFGVSSSFWDRVFGTIAEAPVRQPRRR